MVATRFEDLKVWQQARAVNKTVYQITRKKDFCRDYGFVDQMRRASVSSMNNIAEGFERYRRNDFLHYLTISKASAGEVRSMLYVALDVGYIDEATFNELHQQLEDLGRSIGRFRVGLERSTPKATAGRTRR